MKRFYLSEIESLRNHLMLIAEKATNSVRNAIEALEQGDVELAEEVIVADDEIDELEVAIDAEASRYITLRAPVASDLRLITVAMKASHDLERIGDEATSIAKRTIRLGTRNKEISYGAIRKMADMTLGLIREAVDSLIEENSTRARELPAKDRIIDDLHRENYTLYTQKVMSNPQLAPAYIELIFISKSLERIGDHATNIAEEVVYLKKGEDIRHTDEVRRKD
ncbi:MAG: phosphate signaling complex protein PhoU [Opitutales bacterium]|nr:phosphate signaling complex protein PhoU [Opitutales bacterium]